MPEPVRRRLSITRLTHKGDGQSDDGVYVPYTVAGDIVNAEVMDGRGQVAQILTASPDRVDPLCSHFGACGGCALQHVHPERLAAWKHEQVAAALSQQGLKETNIARTFVAPPRSRRRAELHARITAQGLRIGFLQRGGHVIVDMQHCEILRPELLEFVGTLRRDLPALVPAHRTMAVHVLLTETGIDLSLGIPDFELDASRRQAMSALAARLDVCRLAINRDVIVVRREPVVRLAGHAVIPPPEGFLQAVKEAELALQEQVNQALDGSRAVADLFAGCGTFAFALAAKAPVHAVESEEAALIALQHGAKHASGLKPITTERRDLFRRPLIAQELQRFDGVVLDPPRPGARPQCEHLAQSKVKKLAYVSCNPATFARDAHILVAGGYEMLRVEVIDQFLWSPHIEVIGEFRRS